MNFRIELDLTGDGRWVEWRTQPVSTGETLKETIPHEVQARRIRMACDADTTATAVFTCE